MNDTYDYAYNGLPHCGCLGCLVILLINTIGWALVVGIVYAVCRAGGV